MIELADLAGAGSFYDGLGTSYSDLQNLVNQINQAVASAPPAAQAGIQAVMQRNTGFSTPGFGTVQGLVQQLAHFNPPSNFYDQDQQVLQQALTDIQAAIQQAQPPPPPPPPATQAMPAMSAQAQYNAQVAQAQNVAMAQNAAPSAPPPQFAAQAPAQYAAAPPPPPPPPPASPFGGNTLLLAVGGLGILGLVWFMTRSGGKKSKKGGADYGAGYGGYQPYYPPPQPYAPPPPPYYPPPAPAQPTARNRRRR